MNFSLLDIYLQKQVQGFALFYLRMDQTETALLALMVGHGNMPDEDETPYTFVTVEFLFWSLIRNTFTSFIDMFKKDNDDSKK